MQNGFVQSPTTTATVYTDFTFLRQTLGNGTSIVELTAAQSAAPNPNSAGNVGVDYYPISGFGQTASNFAAKYSNAILGPTTGSLWGTYTYGGFNQGGLSNNNDWVFLAEGTYTGGTNVHGPQLTAGFATVYMDFATTFLSAYAPIESHTLNSCLECYPPQIQSAEFNNIDANNPGGLSHQFSVVTFLQTSYAGPFFDSFIPASGGSGTGPATVPTFNPSTHTFNWNTVGSPLGTYQWHITGTNLYGTTQGTITVHITVPEPAAFSLLLVALSLAALRCPKD